MQIIEVNNARTRKEFLKVPVNIYRNDPVWVQPLNREIEAVFDPSRNNYHSHGKVNRWILKDREGELIGRVASFINDKKAWLPVQPTGGMGFFECINDKEAASLLFDTCKDWLHTHGMKAMDGPINFGENDKFWGLLVWGYTHPSVGMNYNPPYYQTLFEEYGFVKEYEQITRHLDITKPFTDRFTRIAEWVSRKPGYRVEHFQPSKATRYIADFQEIYNDAWNDFDNFAPISQESIRNQFDEMRPVMDEKLIQFAYIKDEPAAFIVCIPDANQIIKKLNGKSGLLSKLKFLYYKRNGTVNRIRILVSGTKHKFRGHGLESIFIKNLQDYVLPLNKYKEVELSWVGDFNTKMQAIHEATGAVTGKKHITYRYYFPD